MFEKLFISTTIAKFFAQNRHFSKKILSGIQPTGEIHMGNYFGVISQWLDIQHQDEPLTIMIADLHSITLPHAPTELNSNIRKVAAALLACGLKPEHVTIFQQSTISAHCELNWYLSCVCTMARLAHLPQFKEKSASLKDVPLSIYVYPVLQAADILLHRATLVPVGEDQKQHVELAQELCRMFNRRYGDTFLRPKCLIRDDLGSRLKSLRDPSKKMSKSDPDRKARICLTDNADDIRIKIQKAVTDCNPTITFEPQSRPGISNLIQIYSLVCEQDIETLCSECENLNTVQFKERLAEAVVSFLQPIQQAMEAYLNDKYYVDDILNEGTKKSQAVAEETINAVKRNMGVLLERTPNQMISKSQL